MWKYTSNAIKKILGYNNFTNIGGQRSEALHGLSNNYNVQPFIPMFHLDSGIIN